MTILKGYVTPISEELPVEIEVAYRIVSELHKKKLLKVRKEVLGGKPLYIWEITTEAEAETWVC